MPQRHTTVMPAAIIKQNERRTVYVDPAENTVVKHFHSPRLGGLVRNRRRARHEFRMLETLRERGVAVPRPISVRRPSDVRDASELSRPDRGWELVLERIPTARTLAECIAEGDRWRGGRGTLARELAQLLASALQAGLRHPDLHPGNVLIDEEQRAWLIDFHSCRIRRAQSASALREMLVGLTSTVRESLPEAFRARFLRELGTALGRDLLSEAGSIEEQACLMRRERVERHAPRATRHSGLMRPIQGTVRGKRRPGFVWRGLDETQESDLLRCLALPRELPDTDSVLPGLHQAPTLVLSGRTARQRFLNLTRLREHRLLNAQGLLWVPAHRGAPALGLAFLPVAEKSLREVLNSERLNQRDARAAGAFIGRFHDRALALPDEPFEQLCESIGMSQAGRWTVAPPTHIGIPTAGDESDLSFVSQLSKAFPAARESLVAGFVGAQRHGSEQRASLRAAVQ